MGSPELHTLASWSTTDMYTRCVVWSPPCLSQTFLSSGSVQETSLSEVRGK